MPIHLIGDTPRIERGALGDKAGTNHPIEVIGGNHGDGERVFNLVHNMAIMHLTGCLSMSPDTAVDVVENLRVALKNRAVKLTVLAEKIDIPYRSLQNYFSKRSEMPLGVYIRICQYAAIPPQYPIHGLRFKIDWHPLQNALINILGENIPGFSIDEKGMYIQPPPSERRDAATLRRDAMNLVALLESEYDQALERDMRRPLDED